MLLHVARFHGVNCMLTAISRIVILYLHTTQLAEWILIEMKKNIDASWYRIVYVWR